MSNDSSEKGTFFGTAYMEIVKRVLDKIHSEIYAFIIIVIILLIWLVLESKVELVSRDLIIIVLSIVIFVLIGIRRHSSKSQELFNDQFPDILNFEQMIDEFESTLRKLEESGVASFKNQENLSRILDGLYSSVLYITRALINGHINPVLYGNLMEVDENRNSLRIRYFQGPYNVDIIDKEYPLEKESVASIAFNKGYIKIENSMELETKVKGERLQALMSIPIESSKTLKHGYVAVLNIDSALKDVFPTTENMDMKNRAEKVKGLIQRINKFKLKFME